MRTILLSTLGAIVILAAFSSCSTTVKTDNGHAVIDRRSRSLVSSRLMRADTSEPNARRP